MNNRITLNIHDLAFLKQNPEEYIEKQLSMIKTHDGTSTGGGFKESLKWFIEDYSQDPFCNTAVFTNDGSEGVVYRATTNTEEQLVKEGIDITKDKYYSEGTDFHIIQNSSPGENPDGTRPGVYYWDSASPVDEPNLSMIGFHDRDVEYLTETNDDGEYLYRSTTIVSPNGKSMTLIKNNSFDEKDHKYLRDIQNDMKKSVNDYVKEYRTQQALNFNELKLEYMKEHNVASVPWEIENKMTHDSHKYAKEQMGGDLYDYLVNQGYPERFETEANIKMRVKNNKDINYQHYVSDAYAHYDDVMEYEKEYDPYIIREDL